MGIIKQLCKPKTFLVECLRVLVHRVYGDGKHPYSVGDLYKCFPTRKLNYLKKYFQVVS